MSGGRLNWGEPVKSKGRGHHFAIHKEPTQRVICVGFPLSQEKLHCLKPPDFKCYRMSVQSVSYSRLAWKLCIYVCTSKLCFNSLNSYSILIMNLCICIQICAYESRCLLSPEVSDSLDLELYVVMSHLTWVLGKHVGLTSYFSSLHMVILNTK